MIEAMKAHDHFQTRWRERGDATICPHFVFREIVLAINHGFDDFIEYVKRDKDRGCDWYRFFCGDNRYYCPTYRGEDGNLYTATEMDQDMWRRKRHGIKHKRRLGV